MEQDKVSPVAIILTFLLHCVLFYCATTNFPHHGKHRSPYTTIMVSIPVATEFHPHLDSKINLEDFIVPPESVIASTETQQPVDKDRYYLPQELSQQVKVLIDETGSLNVPIRQVVTMTLYINEAGSVDDVTIDRKGSLTKEEQDQLIQAFKEMLFLPGMRGAKVVKSIYRIQLEINRKLIIIR